MIILIHFFRREAFQAYFAGDELTTFKEKRFCGLKIKFTRKQEFPVKFPITTVAIAIFNQRKFCHLMHHW